MCEEEAGEDATCKNLAWATLVPLYTRPYPGDWPAYIGLDHLHYLE